MTGPSGKHYLPGMTSKFLPKVAKSEKPITHDDVAYDMEARIRTRTEEAALQVRAYYGVEMDVRLDVEVERLEAQIGVLVRICARLALLSEPIRLAVVEALYEEANTGAQVPLFPIRSDEAIDSLVAAIDGAGDDRPR